MPKTDTPAGGLLPRWIVTCRAPLAVALGFFATALFWGNAGTLVSGELGYAATGHGITVPPGAPLHSIFAQPFLLLPVGSVLFRLTLFATTISALVLYVFGVFLRRRVDSEVVVTLTLVAIAVSALFLRNTLLVSDIPLTLLFILVLFHVVDLRDPLADLRTPLVLVFLIGMGCGGLHPSLRFLVPPLVILWLTTLRVSPRLFTAVPLFFLLGFGVVLFIPLAHHQVAHLPPVRGPGGILSYLSAASGDEGALTPSRFFSHTKLMAEHLADSFPFFLFPLAVTGIWYGYRSPHRRDFMTFFGVGIAAFLYAAWLKPREIPSGGTGLITLFALWTAVAVGTVGLFGRWGAVIWKNLGMAVILLIAIAAILLNLDALRPEPSDHRALMRAMIRTGKGKGTFLFSEALFSRALVGRAQAELPAGITVLPVRRGQTVSGKTLGGKDHMVFIDPLVRLPVGTTLKYVTPWFGEPVPDRGGGPDADWDGLHRWLLTRPSGSRFARRETARLLTAWGGHLARQGRWFTAFKFAASALFLVPEHDGAQLLKAKVLLAQDRPFEAGIIVNRVLSRWGSSHGAHLLMARILMAQVEGAYRMATSNLSLLDTAKRHLKQAERQRPGQWETAQAFTRNALLGGDAEGARNWHQETLKRGDNHEMVARALHALRRITPLKAP